MEKNNKVYEEFKRKYYKDEDKLTPEKVAGSAKEVVKKAVKDKDKID